ncbi:MAG: hypothetical protein RIB78_10650 [Gammaproteobacteria bacterium]
MKKLVYFLVFISCLGAGFIFLSGTDTRFFDNIVADTDDEEEEEESVAALQQLVEGSLMVMLPPETQELAGIETISVEEIRLDAEEKAFATVIDIRPLLELRSRYKNVQAQLSIAETALRNSALNLENLEKLNAETTNVSLRELQQVRAAWEQDKAILQSEQVRLQNIRDEMLQRWGSEITGWALKGDSELFNRLLQQQEYLVMLSLRPEQVLTESFAYVLVNRNGDRQTARKAYLVSVAPYSESNLQGETYFLRTNADKLRVGMRLHVWLPGTGYSGEGIGIPDSAIVWHAGKAWAYVQVDEQTFSRRSLASEVKTEDGWLVRKHFQVGERIVISGAQTLLSEEFKWAIPEEDDD